MSYKCSSGDFSLNNQDEYFHLQTAFVGLRRASAAHQNHTACYYRCNCVSLSTISQVYFRLTRQTLLQPLANHFNNPPPSKPLAPTPRMSYQMFFQNVTPSFPISVRMFMGLLVGAHGCVPCISQRTLTYSSPPPSPPPKFHRRRRRPNKRAFDICLSAVGW